MPNRLNGLFCPRFSLRALLVVVTVGCVVIGWRANGYLKNCRALKSIRARYNEVMIFQGEGRQALGSDLPVLGDANVLEINLGFPKANAYPQGQGFWEDLSGFRSLKKLEVTFVDPPEQNANYAAATTITAVDFRLCSFSEKSLSLALGMMPRVESISMTGCRIEPRVLESLSSIKSLKSLTLNQSRIDQGTIHRTLPKQLRRLIISGKMVSLSKIDMQAISGLNYLEELSLQSGPFDMDLLNDLKKCSSLKLLTVDLGLISPEDCKVAQLEMENALPNCKVKLLRYDVKL